MRDSVPSASYSSVCNVLHQWNIPLIPTYRVYRLYNIYIYIHNYVYIITVSVCSVFSAAIWLQDEFSRLVEKWNAQRAQAVYTALVKVLYPIMQKELRTKLLVEAKDHVLQVHIVYFIHGRIV